MLPEFLSRSLHVFSLRFDATYLCMSSTWNLGLEGQPDPDFMEQDHRSAGEHDAFFFFLHLPLRSCFGVCVSAMISWNFLFSSKTTTTWKRTKVYLNWRLPSRGQKKKTHVLRVVLLVSIRASLEYVTSAPQSPPKPREQRSALLNMWYNSDLNIGFYASGMEFVGGEDENREN